MALQAKQRKRSNPEIETARAAALAEKICRLNTPFNESEYREMKARAAREGTTMADITRKLWRDYLGT
jgi:hypothetical protein